MGFAVGVVGETKWSVRVVVWCSDAVVAGVDSVAVVKVVGDIALIVVLDDWVR